MSRASPNFKKTHSSLEGIVSHLTVWTGNLCPNQGLAGARRPTQGRGILGRQMAVGQEVDTVLAGREGKIPAL